MRAILPAVMEEADEVVVHSLRKAADLFGVTPDTIRQWCIAGRLDGKQEAGTNSKPGTWTIRVPNDHPDLIANRDSRPPPTHYPRVEDQRDIEIARITAERDRLLNEVEFLREQNMTFQRQLPDLASRLVEQLRPALAPPQIEERPWWAYLWPWWRANSS